MKLLQILMIVFGKLISKIMCLFHRQAGNLPGLILTTLNKNCLQFFTLQASLIGCTGTNGKTTVTNFLRHMFELEGKYVISNLEGNNLDTGICSLLLKYCTVTGKVKADYIILETDELHVSKVFSLLKPETLIVLNFFRDQLDRNGETEILIEKIGNFCSTFKGNLILNGDDPNVVRLGSANLKNPFTFYFHVGPSVCSAQKSSEAGEGFFCPVCSSPLLYEYYQYSHIGNFFCPICGYGHNEPYVSFSKVNIQKGTFSADGKDYLTSYRDIYSVYNLCAVYTAAKAYGIKENTIQSAFRNFRVDNGRLETFQFSNRTVLLNLAKNPVGAALSLSMLNETEEKELLLALNDFTADGHDVSWIWDVDFHEKLNGVKRIITSGARAYDMAIRIRYSGFERKNIHVYPNTEEAVERLLETEGKKYIIANYTALQPIRETLKKRERTERKDV